MLEHTHIGDIDDAQDHPAFAVFALRKYLANGGKPGTPRHEWLVWAARQGLDGEYEVCVDLPTRPVLGNRGVVVGVEWPMLIVKVPEPKTSANIRRCIRAAIRLASRHRCKGRRFNRGKGGQHTPAGKKCWR